MESHEKSLEHLLKNIETERKNKIKEFRRDMWKGIFGEIVKGNISDDIFARVGATVGALGAYIGIKCYIVSEKISQATNFKELSEIAKHEYFNGITNYIIQNYDKVINPNTIPQTLEVVKKSLVSNLHTGTLLMGVFGCIALGTTVPYIISNTANNIGETVREYKTLKDTLNEFAENSKEIISKKLAPISYEACESFTKIATDIIKEWNYLSADNQTKIDDFLLSLGNNTLSNDIKDFSTEINSITNIRDLINYMIWRGI